MVACLYVQGILMAQPAGQNGVYRSVTALGVQCSAGLIHFAVCYGGANDTPSTQAKVLKTKQRILGSEGRTSLEYPSSCSAVTV